MAQSPLKRPLIGFLGSGAQQGSQKSGKATGRSSIRYKYRRARASRVRLAHEDENAFAFRIDIRDVGGSIGEHVASVDDFKVAEATYRASVARWPAAGSCCGRVPASCTTAANGWRID